MKLAQQLDAVLLTSDKDFINIKVYPPQEAQGILVLRDENHAPTTVANHLKEALEKLYRDKLRGVLVVVDAEGYSVFPKPESE